MKIYTGTASGCKEKIKHMKFYGLSVMLSGENISKSDSKFSCALDNGAFIAWKYNLPWLESRFWESIKLCWKHKIKLDFIVLPDIVGGGIESYNLSRNWLNKLKPTTLALAVQDGIKRSTIKLDMLKGIKYIFLGGTVEYKWDNLRYWSDYCKEEGLLLHIGRCGSEPKLQAAADAGAFSCDSTSWVQNDSWHILQKYLGYIQQSLFPPKEN